MTKDMEQNYVKMFSLRNLWLIGVLAFSYYLMAKLSLLITPLNFHVGLFWPVSGLAVFFVLRYGLNVLPGIFIGQLVLLVDLNNTIADLQSSQQLLLFASQALNVSLFIFLARFLILRFTHYQGDIFENTNIPRLSLLAGPLSSIIPMLISIYLLKDTDLVLEDGILFSALTWWVGDSLGIAIFLPVLLLVFNKNAVTAVQKIVVLGMVSILLISTFTLFKHVENDETQFIENILISKGQRITQEINNKMQFYMHLAAHLNTDLADGQPLSLSNFNQFAKHLLAENKTINHLEWGELVDDKQRNQFEKSLQVLYKDKFRIQEMNSTGEIINSPLKSQYYPVKFVYPYAENKQALGFDFTQQQGELNNLLLAIANHENTLSNHIDWTQDENFQGDYITLYSPFYSNQKESELSERQFVGYLSLAVDKSMFFAGLTDNRLYKDIQFDITDSSDKLEELLFEHNINKDYKVHVLHSAQVVNRLWSIRLRANQDFLTKNKISTAWYILVSGLVVTTLMLMALLLLIRKQKQLQKLVDNKHEIVKESLSHQSLLSATFNTHQAILITDPKYNIIRVNSAFCEIMGYTEVEVVGENPKMFSSGRQSLDFYKEMWAKLLGTGRYEGEIWNRRKNGEIFPEYQTITEIRDAQGEILYYISVFSDITKLKQDEEKIRHQAFYDLLTLLPNKMLFLDRLDQEVAYARRFDGVGCLLLIDIDNFKGINELLGHHYGDDVLIELGGRLAKMLRNTDTVAHLGGDDFVVFMPVEKDRELDAQENAIMVAEKILEQIHQPFFIKDKDYYLTASLGISYIKKNKCTASDILRQAESALYKAKLNGKNGYQFFQDES